MVQKRASKIRTARRDNKWGAADRNRAVRGHVACARASAALARPTPPPVAVRRRGLRGFVRETGRVKGRTWVGKERATKWPRRRAISQAPTSEIGSHCCLFSRARVLIAGPILRTRFWSRKRDHAADVGRPQMTIPCMTSSAKSTFVDTWARSPWSRFLDHQVVLKSGPFSNSVSRFWGGTLYEVLLPGRPDAAVEICHGAH